MSELLEEVAEIMRARLRVENDLADVRAWLSVKLKTQIYPIAEMFRPVDDLRLKRLIICVPDLEDAGDGIADGLRDEADEDALLALASLGWVHLPDGTEESFHVRPRPLSKLTAHERLNGVSRVKLALAAG